MARNSKKKVMRGGVQRGPGKFCDKDRFTGTDYALLKETKTVNSSGMPETVMETACDGCGKPATLPPPGAGLTCSGIEKKHPDTPPDITSAAIPKLNSALANKDRAKVYMALSDLLLNPNETSDGKGTLQGVKITEPFGLQLKPKGINAVNKLLKTVKGPPGGNKGFWATEADGRGMATSLIGAMNSEQKIIPGSIIFDPGTCTGDTVTYPNIQGQLASCFQCAVKIGSGGARTRRSAGRGRGRSARRGRRSTGRSARRGRRSAGRGARVTRRRRRSAGRR